MSRTASRTQAALIGGAVALGMLLTGCTSTCRTSGERESVGGRQRRRTVLTGIAILSPAQLAFLEP